MFLMSWFSCLCDSSSQSPVWNAPCYVCSLLICDTKATEWPHTCFLSAFVLSPRFRSVSLNSSKTCQENSLKVNLLSFCCSDNRGVNRNNTAYTLYWRQMSADIFMTFFFLLLYIRWNISFHKVIKSHKQKLLIQHIIVSISLDFLVIKM